MGMFGTRGRPELVSAADAVEAVDGHVRVLYSLLERSAGVLSEVEYGALVREFEQVVAPVRELRVRFDRLLDDGGEDSAAFAQVSAEINAHLPALVSAEESLREYADAQTMCTRTSGELLNDLARIERSPLADDAQWAQLATWGREQIQAAAAQAEDRNWLTAHRILMAARHTLAQAGAQVEHDQAELDRKRSRISALAAAGTVLRAQGADAVEQFEKLNSVSPADAAPYRAALVEAGATFQEISSAVAAWNTDPHDPAYDIDALEVRAADAKSGLARFTAYASEVLR